METTLFKNGDQMPNLGLGTWNSAPGDAYTAVKEAVRQGYRHIDCAAIYANEKEIGQALSECFAEKLVTREELWITSKLWNDRHAPEDVLPALEKTLADLQLEYLDLYLMHWPVALKKGVPFPRSATDMISLDELPIAVTWSAMEALVGRGLARHIGVSNFGPARLRELHQGAAHKPEVDQVELHPYLQQNDLLAVCRELSVALTAYSPLGSNGRPERLKRAGDPILLDDPVLADIARHHGVTPAQVLIRWAMQRGTSVIPKSVRPTRTAENLAAAGARLTGADMERIAALERGLRCISGAFWAVEGSSYTLTDLWR